MRITSIFVLLLCASLTALPAAAQNTAPGPGYKDPGTATLVGVLVAGGGQLYTGEVKRGLTIFGAGLGSLMLGSLLVTNEADNCIDSDFEDCSATGFQAAALLGYVGYLGAWAYGIVDASDSAKRVNARNGVTVAGVQVEPIAAPSRDGTRVGVTLRF